jgi:hypothetical protein
VSVRPDRTREKKAKKKKTWKRSKPPLTAKAMILWGQSWPRRTGEHSNSQKKGRREKNERQGGQKMFGEGETNVGMGRRTGLFLGPQK